MTGTRSGLRGAGIAAAREQNPQAEGGRAEHRRLKRLAAHLLFAGSLLLPATAHAQTTTVAGVTDGSLAVGADGGASYSIPIKVPPGITGMAPSLSIGYSSNGGNGVMGVGWSLGGLSTIHRCSKTLAQDGEIKGINFDADDRYCLDGQRLVAISGAYGADGTEYRTEVESFTKVMSYGAAGAGPAYFMAWTKSGQVIEYGLTADSRVEAQGRPDVSLWAANKISDTVGNYLTMSYSENPTTGASYIDRIDYAGNVAAGVAPFASVRFSYEARSDSTFAYQAGSLITNDQRLTDIQTFVGESLLRDYRVAYELGAGTGRSRLVSITECNGTGECLQPTSFNWKQDGAGFTSQAAYNLPAALYGTHGGVTSKHGELLDINGDGLTDFVESYLRGGSSPNKRSWLNTGSGWQQDTAYDPPFLMYFEENSPKIARPYGEFADVNGDNLPDFVLARAGGGSSTRITYLNTGTGWAISSNYQLPSFLYSHTNDPAMNWPRGQLIDVNGDGLVDFVQSFASGAGTNKATWLNTGSGWQQSAAYLAPFVLFFHSNSPAIVQPLGQFQDVNGDGLPDFIVAYTGSGNAVRTTWLNTGNGWQESTPHRPPFITHNFHNDPGLSLQRGQFLDLNGDGLSDFLESFRGRTGNTTQTAWLNTGNGWLESPSHTLPTIAFFHESVPETLRRFGSFLDVNGDGLTDFVRAYTKKGTTYQATWLNTGNGWLESAANAPPFVTDNVINDPATQLQRGEFSDINGDGAVDFVEAVGGTRATWLGNAAAPDLIETVTDSLGAQASLSYAPLTDPNVYEKGSGAVFPVIDVQGPLYVVEEVSRDDGVGGQARTSYAYGQARMHVQGRGFLGFGQMHATDVLTGITISTTNRQDYPFTGMVSFSETYLADDTTLKTATNSYAATALNGGLTTFPHMSQSVAESYEINGGPGNLPITTATVTSSYDGFGNVTSLVSTTSDGSQSFVTTTVSSYDNDTVNWFLGRVRRTDVTQQLPDGTTSTRASAFAYDPATGLLSQEVVEPDLPAFRLTTDYTRDVFGNILTTTVSGADITTRGTTTDFTPDGRFPEVTTNALGHSETSIFDPALDTVVSLTGPNGITTTWNYDGFGRRVREDRADGTATVWEYRLKPPGTTWHEYYVFEKPILAATGATIGPINLTYFDLLNRVTLTRTDGFDGTSVYVNTHYNDRGEVSAVSRPYFDTAPAEERQWTTTAYDVIGRPTWVVAPDGGVTSPVYDGLTTTITNALGQIETRTNNAIGQLIQATDNAGTTVTYGYDHHGNLVETNAGGVVTTMDYDIRGRKIAMDDPDMGVWSYAYNVLGELVSQTDAKGQTVTTAYDKLGRMTSRTEPEGTTTRSYDNPIKTAAIGKPDTITRSQDDYLENYVYDALGRATQTTVIYEGAVYDITRSYDSAGRLATLTYPSGFAIEQGYNAFGYLEEVRELGGAGTVYWRAVDVDAEGRAVEEQLGNGLTTLRDFDPADGLIRSTQVWQDAATLRLNQTFDFDKLGNLLSRGDLHENRSESFTYDNLNRLTGSSLIDTVTLTQLGQTTYAYDALGNLTSKSDVGAYLYGTGIDAGPHAVTSAGGKSYAYDLNGAMTSTATTASGTTTRSVSWSSFNKPVHVTAHDTLGTTDLVYGPGRGRIKQTVVKGSAITTITYVGGLFEKHAKAGSADKLKHYIRAGGTVAIYTQVDDGNAATDKTRYLHKDHLGSIVMITREDGSVSLRRSHEAFGLARKGNWEASNDPHSMWETPRGFTGHEHLTSVGLIHMNGRVYDPEIGRFLSADPFVAAPDTTQGFNRYSYVLNNPLSFTDPSGFIFKKIKNLAKRVHNAHMAAGDWIKNHLPRNKALYALENRLLRNKFVQVVGFAVASYYGGPLGAALFAARVQEAYGGDFEDMARAAAIAYATGVAAGAVGAAGQAALNAGVSSTAVIITKTVAHGVIGGVSSKLQGGSFERGFAVGAIASAAGEGAAAIKGTEFGPVMARTSISAVAGGITAKLGGGKFVNGAVTGAFKRLYLEAPNLRMTFRGALQRDVWGPDGRVVATVSGGTLSERNRVFGNLENVVGTERGRIMALTIEEQKIPMVIKLNNQQNLSAFPNGGHVNIDPNVNPEILTTSGLVRASTTRIISHELGHAVFGTGDTGHLGLDNVNQNENPVMLELGGAARTSY